MIKILRVHVVAPSVLELQFSTGETAHFHGEPYLRSRTGTLLTALRNPDYFARAFVDAGALCWPNGLELSASRVLELSTVLAH